jgi:hypothetical protein
MDKINEEQLKLEVAHIFDSGANELRVLEMVKNFIDSRKAVNKNFVLADVSGTSSLHHCGNELTEKEVFYDHCLKCSEYLIED